MPAGGDLILVFLLLDHPPHTIAIPYYTLAPNIPQGPHLHHSPCCGSPLLPVHSSGIHPLKPHSCHQLLHVLPVVSTFLLETVPSSGSTHTHILLGGLALLSSSPMSMVRPVSPFLPQPCPCSSRLVLGRLMTQAKPLSCSLGYSAMAVESWSFYERSGSESPQGPWFLPLLRRLALENYGNAQQGSPGPHCWSPAQQPLLF